MAGRPSKYSKIDLAQVEIFGELGLTDVETSKALNISKATLTKYKKQYPEFIASLKKGKDVSDQKVVRSLFRRACGYSHPEVHISNFQGKITKTEIIKHYPPEVAACIYWLNNRRNEWSNQGFRPGDEDSNKPISFEGWK